MTERGGRIATEIEIVKRGRKKEGKGDEERKTKRKQNPRERLKGMDSLLNRSSMSTSF